MQLHVPMKVLIGVGSIGEHNAVGGNIISNEHPGGSHEQDFQIPDPEGNIGNFHDRATSKRSPEMTVPACKFPLGGNPVMACSATFFANHTLLDAIVSVMSSQSVSPG